MWSICYSCPYLRLEVWGCIRLDEAISRDRFISHLIKLFSHWKSQATLVLCRSTRSLHIPPYCIFSSPYCTCSYEKWSFYKVRKHSRKGRCTKYQICRFSKVYSWGRYENSKNIFFLKLYLLHACFRFIYIKRLAPILYCQEETHNGRANMQLLCSLHPL